MNGWIKRSLSPWSTREDDAASLLSDSVEETKMPFHRKRDDGSYVKNVILKKIYKDFGSLSKAYKNPYYMTYTKSSFPGLHKKIKDENPPGTTNSAKNEPYKPKGTPRYSKIDKFIDNLNQACAALPKPLIEDFGRGRPHTVQVQIQPKVEVRMIKVSESEPTPVQTNANDQTLSKDFASLQSPIKSNAVPTSRATQNICVSPEMGPWKVIDESNRPIVYCGRQTTIPCLKDAFESKKEEVVRTATMLQARYMGYKVRRSQPLRYMLMIGCVKSKLEELKQQFTAWKIAVWFPTDYHERLSMAENITNLLTKLHSIKGVPLYIKEFRKSVTRDVLKLQEDVDIFLRHKGKQTPLCDPLRKVNKQRPKSRTQRRATNYNVSGSPSLNELQNSWKTVEFSNTMQREFGSGEDLPRDLDSNDVNSIDISESEESEVEDSIQSNSLEVDFISLICPKEVVRPQEHSILCPQLSIEMEVKEDNEINQNVEHVAFDIFIPTREDSSKTSRKKKYGVRFREAVRQREKDIVIEPCSIIEESLLSSKEELIGHDVPVLKYDHEHLITSSSSIQPFSIMEQSFHKAGEGLSSHDVSILTSSDQHIVESRCSNGNQQTKLTDILEQNDDVYFTTSIPMLVVQNESFPTTDVRDEVGSKKQDSQPDCFGNGYDQNASTKHNTVAIHVHTNEPLDDTSSKSNFLDSNDNVHVHGQLNYQFVMDDVKNASVNDFGGFGVVTIPTKSMFHNEQSQLWTNHDGSRSGHNHVQFEGPCNSSDSTTSETSERLDKLEEHDKNCKVFCLEGTWTKIPPLEQKEMVTLAGKATDLRALLESPRLQRSCEDSPSMRMSSKNILDKRTSDKETVIDVENNVDIDGVQKVNKVSCCSDCARPHGYHLSESWKPIDNTREEELQMRLPCNEYRRDVHESYVSLGCKSTSNHDEYFQPSEREEFCGFDHRELRYVVDPYTWKLKRAKQVAQTNTFKNDHIPFQQEKQASVVVQPVPKAYAHKATSHTPTLSETISSKAEISDSRCKSHSSFRRAFIHEEKRAWEPDEGHIGDKELLTKLADDNKRLKRLLKDVMNWNKAQATAMVSMSERIGHLEGLDNLH